MGVMGVSTAVKMLLSTPPAVRDQMIPACPAGVGSRDVYKVGPSRPGKVLYDPLLQRYQLQKSAAENATSFQDTFDSAPIYHDKCNHSRPDVTKNPHIFKRKKVGLSEWNDTSYYMAKFMGSTSKYILSKHFH
jgi:hypothetical protein